MMNANSVEKPNKYIHFGLESQGNGWRMTGSVFIKSAKLSDLSRLHICIRIHAFPSAKPFRLNLSCSHDTFANPLGTLSASLLDKSLYFTAGTSICRSMRSRSGPDLCHVFLNCKRLTRTLTRRIRFEATETPLRCLPDYRRQAGLFAMSDYQPKSHSLRHIRKL